MPETQQLLVYSRDRVQGDTTNCTFNISPPIERGSNWKILEWSGSALVGPQNNTSIDVTVTYATNYDCTVVQPVYTTRKYPALNPIVQPNSLYDDYCGFLSTEPNYTAANLESQLNFPIQHPSPAPFLYTQYVLTGYAETGGATSVSAQTQLAANLQWSLRQAIAEAVVGWCNQVTPADNSAYRDTSVTKAGMVFPPDSVLGAYSGNAVRYQDFGYPSAPQYVVQCHWYDTWVLDIPSLFHVVPPGATISHLSTSCSTVPAVSGGPGNPQYPPAPTSSTELVQGTVYTFTNTSSAYAFVFMPDDALAMNNNITDPGTLPGPYNMPPWVTNLTFTINGTMARVFGLQDGVPFSVAGLPTRDPNYTFADQANGHNYLLPRWPARKNIGMYNTVNDVGYNRAPTFMAIDSPQSNAGKTISVPTSFATFAPGLAGIPAPVLNIYCSLMVDHQTRTTNVGPGGGVTTLALRVPLGTDASQQVSYLNTTSDYPNTVRQERISQISFQLALENGDLLNSAQTLPPGFYNISNGALVPSYPEWTMAMAFTAE